MVTSVILHGLLSEPTLPSLPWSSVPGNANDGFVPNSVAYIVAIGKSMDETIDGLMNDAALRRIVDIVDPEFRKSRRR